MRADRKTWIGEYADSLADFRVLPCEGPPRLLAVSAGALDLFVFRLDANGRAGARHAVARFETGDTLVCADMPATLQGWQAVYVPVPGTRVVAVDVDRVMVDTGNEELAAVMQRWAGRLLDSVERGLVPSVYRVLEPGPPILAVQGDVLSTPVGMVWIEIVEGEVSPFGEGRVCIGAGSIVPLHPESWLTVRCDARLAPIEFERVCAEGRLIPAATAIQGFVFELFVERVAAAAQALAERLDQRREGTEVALRRAFSRLNTLFRVKDAAIGGGDATDPVLAACRQVGAVQGIAFPDLPRSARDFEPVRRLEAAVVAAQVRKRRVALRGRWWEGDNGPLVAFAEGDDTAHALLPAPGGGYTLVNGSTGVRSRVGEAEAASLAPFAYSFFRAFPGRRLGAFDLLRFGFAHQRRDLLAIAAAATLIGLLGMVVPIATGYLIDEAVPSASRIQLAQISAALLGAAIATLMFSLVRSVALLRLESRMDSAVQSAVWDRVLKLPVGFFRQYEAGDLASRINAVNTIRQSLSGTTLSGMLTAVFSLFNLALLLFYDMRLALLAMGVVAIAVLINVVVALLVLREERPLADVEGRLGAVVLQFLTGIAKLRAAAAETRAFSRWAQLFADARRHAIRAESARNVSQVFMPSFVIVVTALLYLFAAGLLTPTAEGPAVRGLTTGQFVSFSAAFTGFLTSFVQFVDTTLELLRLVPQVERAQPILEAVPESGPNHRDPGALRGAIDVSNVVFRYRADGPPVLDGVSLSARPGEFLAIVGSSGSGKSTLLRLLLGFERAESGTIRFDRQDLLDLDMQAVRSQFGVVLQSSQLMPGDIYTNIVGTHALTVDDAWDAARLCGLDSDIEAMPMGMHTVIGEGASTLSGGQRQRILIARAIVRRPRIILFDEATSALDNQTQMIVARSLERLKATRIVIAHRLSTILNADRIVVLEAGRVVQSGTYAELVNQPGVFADLARRQLA